MKVLTRAATWELNIRLRRAAERMERRRPVKQDNQPDVEAAALAIAVADLCDEYARGVA